MNRKKVHSIEVMTWLDPLGLNKIIIYTYRNFMLTVRVSSWKTRAGLLLSCCRLACHGFSNTLGTFEVEKGLKIYHFRV